MKPTQLLEDFASNKRYGSIEFVYKGGNIVFVKKIETLIPEAPYEKNSMEAPRGTNGVDHRKSATNN
jgi:hypothetical protein